MGFYKERYLLLRSKITYDLFIFLLPEGAFMNIIVTRYYDYVNIYKFLGWMIECIVLLKYSIMICFEFEVLLLLHYLVFISPI